jgi:hypothetical protein
MPKNSNLKNAQKQYAKKMRALRPFVNFDVDLRTKIAPSQKKKITIYFNELQRMTQGKPYALQILKPRKKSRLKNAQYVAGQRTDLPGFKVAFLPVTSDRQKARFNKKDELIVESPNVSATFIKFDPTELAKNPLEYVNEKVRDRKEKVFTVQAGDLYELKSSASKSKIANEVAKLVEKYGEAEGLTPEDNHYYKKWLIGINANKFKNQKGKNFSYKTQKRAFFFYSNITMYLKIKKKSYLYPTLNKN